MMRAWRTAALWLPLLLAAGAATAAPGVILAGRMGLRALLVIDGRPYTVAVGEVVEGVRLVGWRGDIADVETAGKPQTLRIGAVPAQVLAAVPSTSGREIVIPVGEGGHFTTSGSIRGHNVQYMIDTGATMVSMSRSDALRMGVDMSSATQGYMHTANGQVLVQMLTLPQMRVGDVEVNNVSTVVLPLPMPYVLLGNSFLMRFQMRRENDVMRLEAR